MRHVVAIGRRLHVYQNRVSVLADRIVIGDAERAFFHRHALDQFCQARFIALKRRLAAVQTLDLPAGPLGAPLHPGHLEAGHVGQQRRAGNAYVAHAYDNDVHHAVCLLLPRIITGFFATNYTNSH